MTDPFMRVLGSRVTFGICAIILAGNAIFGRVWQEERLTDRQDEQTAEQECRAARVAALFVATARAIQRVELGLVEVSEGDEDGLAVIVRRSQEQREAYDEAIFEQANAVEDCREAG